MGELIELIEGEYKDFTGEIVNTVYCIYEGDWVQVISDSANPYWHDFRKWDEDPRLRRYAYLDRRSILVTAADDGRYVGHFKSLNDFLDWFIKWMRGTIVETLVFTEV